MTPQTDMGRAARLAALLDGAGVEVLLVTHPINVRWLTGFTGSSGLVLVGADGLREFVTDFRYLSQSADELDAGWERRIVPATLTSVLPELLTGRTRLGFDDAAVTVKEHGALHELLTDDVQLVPTAGLVEGLRAVKDEAELERLRAAARLADAALLEVLGRGLVGRTERDVGLDLEFTMRRMGADLALQPVDRELAPPPGPDDPHREHDADGERIAFDDIGDVVEVEAGDQHRQHSGLLRRGWMEADGSQL